MARRTVMRETLNMRVSCSSVGSASPTAERPVEMPSASTR